MRKKNTGYVCSLEPNTWSHDRPPGKKKLTSMGKKNKKPNAMVASLLESQVDVFFVQYRCVVCGVLIVGMFMIIFPFFFLGFVLFLLVLTRT